MDHYKTDYLDGTHLTTKGRIQVISRLNADGFSTPHCKANTLHTPGACKYCDMYPDWQTYRIMCDMAFTAMKS